MLNLTVRSCDLWEQEQYKVSFSSWKGFGGGTRFEIQIIIYAWICKLRVYCSLLKRLAAVLKTTFGGKDKNLNSNLYFIHMHIYKKPMTYDKSMTPCKGGIKGESTSSRSNNSCYLILQFILSVIFSVDSVKWSTLSS